MTRKEALIIFVRKPELGKVKTRLAASIGAEAALAVYRKLLEHTYTVTLPLPCEKYVFYAGAIELKDLWSDGYGKLVQEGDDLGERMKAAFSFLFQKGHQHICIVGSDCFELTTEIIQAAFAVLNGKEMVIGPAKDGGYYLLGMNGEVKEVFDGIAWSTENVFAQTKEKAEQHLYTYAILPVLADVDTVEDVPAEIMSAVECIRKR